jgi:hypothetical protein
VPSRAVDRHAVPGLPVFLHQPGRGGDLVADHQQACVERAHAGVEDGLAERQAAPAIEGDELGREPGRIVLRLVFHRKLAAPQAQPLAALQPLTRRAPANLYFAPHTVLIYSLAGMDAAPCIAKRRFPNVGFDAHNTKNQTDWVLSYMPTIFRLSGWRVCFYSNDHRPAHVHVMSGRRECVFDLNCIDGPVTLNRNHGCSLSELNWIACQLNEELAKLCESWRSFHGDYR